jgi:hypothetical protein
MRVGNHSTGVYVKVFHWFTGLLTANANFFNDLRKSVHLAKSPSLPTCMSLLARQPSTRIRLFAAVEMLLCDPVARPRRPGLSFGVRVSFDCDVPKFRHQFAPVVSDQTQRDRFRVLESTKMFFVSLGRCSEREGPVE